MASLDILKKFLSAGTSFSGTWLGTAQVLFPQN